MNSFQKYTLNFSEPIYLKSLIDNWEFIIFMLLDTTDLLNSETTFSHGIKSTNAPFLIFDIGSKAIAFLGISLIALG
jgi:hypothetical protein